MKLDHPCQMLEVGCGCLCDQMPICRNGYEQRSCCSSGQVFGELKGAKYMFVEKEVCQGPRKG